MERNFAKELYQESLQLSKLELGPTSTANSKQSDSGGCDEDDLWDGDGSLWHGSDEELDKASDLEREWQRRHNQFHTIGFRDGLIAGKEASAQEGFNTGFKQSVLIGYNWGLVRGVTSALPCLPDGLRESLIETQEKRNKIQGLYESVHALSTTEALKMFHDDIMRTQLEESQHAETSSHVLQEQRSDCSSLDNYFEELQTLLRESPETKVQLTLKQ